MKSTGGVFGRLVPLWRAREYSLRDSQQEESSDMPTYSYVCRACRKAFSLQMAMAEHDKGRTKCPKCGSRSVQQKIGAFSAVTKKKS